MSIDFETVVPKFDAILSRGLSKGVGQRDGQMCVEAAICAALDLPHDDDPGCVDPFVRRFKIGALNDNLMIRALTWRLSASGGLHIYEYPVSPEA